MQAIANKVILTVGSAMLVTSLFFNTTCLAATSGKITGDNVNFRKAASYDCKVYKLLDKGTKISVLGSKGEWKKVKIGGKVGFVSERYVSSSSSSSKSNSSSSIKAQVSVDRANFRSAPNLNSKVYKVYSMGTSVKIIGSTGDWYKVRVDGKSGYFRKDMLDKSTTTSKTNRGSSSRNSVVDVARKYLGKRYVYGGSSPSGFDCSGFVRYVYRQFGYDLPHSSSAMSAHGKTISKSNLKPGDLLFFRRGGSSIGHVAIYIGNGKMIHAENARQGVNIDTVFDGDYYQRNYVKAKRIM